MKERLSEKYVQELESKYITAIQHILSQDKNRDAFATSEYLKLLEEHLKELKEFGDEHN